MPLIGPIFYEACDHLIQAEGGFVNNPNDPGGATKYGITLKTLRAFKKNDALDLKDIEAMNLDTAQEIYLESFYKPLGLDLCLNRWACIILLDQAANRGLSAVQVDLTQSLGYKLSPSYPKIVDILNFYESEFDKLPLLNVTFCIDFLVRSQAHYIQKVKNDPKLGVFLGGWLNRTHRLFYLLKTSPPQ
jgi:glycosyl hydrolase family 108